MAKASQIHSGVSRRGFVKATAVGGAALAATAFPGSAAAQSAGEPTKWDYEADVIVVGLGFAGQTVAITAFDEGASVIVLEKNAADTEDSMNHLSNSRVCGGWYLATDDVEQAAEFVGILGGEMAAPEDMRLAWAEGLAENDAWIESLGGEVWDMPNPMVGGGEHPSLESGKHVMARSLALDGMKAPIEEFYQFFMRNIAEREIPILWEHPGQKLYTDCSGKVVGIMADNNGTEVNIKANKAVVLTCGGYENNQEMLKNWNPGPEWHFLGPPGHDGDGIKMALAVGADLWHTKAASAGAAMFEEGMTSGCMPSVLSTGAAAYTLVDGEGKRFTNDRLNGHNGWMKLTQFDPETYSYPKVPCYLIFDEELRQAGTLIYEFPHTPWSDDNLEEIEKGWIMKADTIGELAEIAGIDPDTLVDTVERYNAACEAGVDEEFGKRESQLLPLVSPPFYAVRMYPGGPNTQGGPRRNAKAQIVRPDGTPIPHLYSAGELGSMYGIQYPGGGNVAECFVYGRIAGRNAAAEEPVGYGSFVVVR